MAELDIDPKIGDAICAAIESSTGRKQVHIILIAFPCENDVLGQPTIVTSLAPEDVPKIVNRMAEYVNEHEPIVVRKHEQKAN